MSAKATKKRLTRFQILTSVLISIALALISNVSTFPFDYYDHFVLEEKHGFNKLVNNR